jgi:HK97 family phage major capsid protein
MVDADVLARSVVSEDATLLTYAGMANCIGGLKSGFANPRYFFNRLSFVELLKLVSTTGSPLWQPGMNGVAASSIFGYGYTLMESMPNIGAGTFPVCLADLGRGYTVVNRTGLSVIRDEITQKRSAILEFTWDKYQTGDVNDAEAFVPLEISA